MLRELHLARPAAMMTGHSAACEHRAVSGDGRIICTRIVEGEAEVSPEVCRDCPFKAADCSHLRFSLRLTSPSPLIVRFNGRQEVWDDGPPELHFERAACAERVMPIDDVRTCAECPLRRPVHTAAERLPAANGTVVPFPERVAAAAG
ncbi:MAG TPA: hypothetical protein VLC95_02130 [Anaerolineae bacterium]|nr:hypothetical protein [Anaerolineae bacterium]